MEPLTDTTTSAPRTVQFHNRTVQYSDTVHRASGAPYPFVEEGVHGRALEAADGHHEGGVIPQQVFFRVLVQGARLVDDVAYL